MVLYTLMKFANKPRRRYARKSPAKKARRGRPAVRGRGRGRRVGILHKNVNCGVGEQSNSGYTNSHGPMDARCRIITTAGDTQRYIRNGTYALYNGPGQQCNAGTFMASQSELKLVADKMQLAYGPGYVVSTDAPARYVLQRGKQILTFANMSSAPCVIKIYDIVNRRDQLQSGNQYVAPSGNFYNFGGNPVSTWAAGESAQQDKGATDSDTINVYGTKPTDSVIFNTYYKVRSITTVQMPVGAVHRHTRNVTFNRLVDASIYGNNQLSGLQGLTEWCLITGEGTPVYQPQDGLGAVSVTTSAVKVDVSEQLEYHSTFVDAFQQGTYVLDEIGEDTNANPTANMNILGISTITQTLP